MERKEVITQMCKLKKREGKVRKGRKLGMQEVLEEGT